MRTRRTILRGVDQELSGAECSTFLFGFTLAKTSCIWKRAFVIYLFNASARVTLAILGSRVSAGSTKNLTRPYPYSFSPY